MSSSPRYEDQFRDPPICRECKGECCKAMPGACMPWDFGACSEEILANLHDAIQSGEYCFDSWDGDPCLNYEGELTLTINGRMYHRQHKEAGFTNYAFYVRPVTQGKEGVIVDFSWGGRCTFLTDTGCQLSWPDRPSECRTIKAKQDREGKCTQEGHNKQDAAVAWLNYGFEVKELISNVAESKNQPYPKNSIEKFHIISV